MWNFRNFRVWKNFRIIFLALIMNGLLITTVGATVVEIDNFDYTDGQIDEKNGGTGWAGLNGNDFDGERYYWQVVEKNSCGQVTGPIWTFTVEPVGDLDFSCAVDLNDYTLLAASWLGDNCAPVNAWCGNADLNKDSRVSIIDMEWLVQNWLKEAD